MTSLQPVQAPYPQVLDPTTGAPFTEHAIQDLIWRLRRELLNHARTFLAETGLDLPDWMALKDAADTLAGLCVYDSLTVAQAQLEPEEVA